MTESFLVAGAMLLSPRIAMMGGMPNANAVRDAVNSALAAGRFFVAAPRELRLSREIDEVVPWEVVRGHLLDAAYSTVTRRFDAWHLELVESAGIGGAWPLISVYWDRQADRMAVVRRILTHGFEGYEDSPGVILSRPIQKWARELVASVELAGLGDREVADELRAAVFLAVIGTSRLPITSLESPLPGFSLGEFAYFPSLPHAQTPWRDSLGLLQAGLSENCHGVEQVKVLETALRATPAARQPRIAEMLAEFTAAQANGTDRILEMLRGLFRHVALSPYGGYVERLLALLAALSRCGEVGRERVANVVASMLTQLCRHLTAFDLATFHNSGANYPDALYLDGLLKLYLDLIEQQPDLVNDLKSDSDNGQKAGKLRRRALRQGALVRKHYEGLLVPDSPTSQGESLRVLPEPFSRVPEAQILHAAARRRKLFTDEPLEQLLTPTARESLRASLADLAGASELCELGTAIFLDRPLGVGKAPGEVDRTPLVSHTAVSRAVCLRRLDELLANGWLSPDTHQQLQFAARETAIGGVAVGELQLLERAGVVTLADALKVAPDFVLTRCAFDEFVRHYAGAAEAFREVAGGMLLVHHAPPDVEPTLRVFDKQGRPRFELGFESTAGRRRYVDRAGIELPERLQVIRSWSYSASNAEPTLRDLRRGGIWLTVRDRPGPS